MIYIFLYRSTTPLPPIDEEKVDTKVSSKSPEEDSTSAEASTQSTITTPFREPRVLSKFRQKQPEIEVINTKPTIKHRTTSSFKKPERLTTSRLRESTVLPTSSFRNRGKMTSLATIFIKVCNFL